MQNIIYKEEYSHNQRNGTDEIINQCKQREHPVLNENDIEMQMDTINGENIYSCTQCDKSFSQKKTLTEHKMTHTEEKHYLCSICDKSFTHKCDLVRHIRTHTGEKPYQCNLCNKSFSLNSTLTRHMKKIHTICKEEYPHKQRDSTDGIPNQCKQSEHTVLNENDIVKPIKTLSGENKYACSQCDKSFSQKKILKGHMMIHTGEKPYQCSNCDKAFNDNCDLKRHIRTHTGERPYQCSQCDKAFSTNSILTRHMKIHPTFKEENGIGKHNQTHTGELPYQCSQCDKFFSLNASLTRHMEIHTNKERPYQCSQCDKTFLTNPILTRHMMIHTEEKPHLCSQCGKAFLMKYNLRIHMQIHSKERPYKCSQCDKAFSTNIHLIRHIKSHTGEKPYLCSQCGKTFSDNYYLKIHLRKHTGEKPYQCSQCEKAFISNYKVKQHMKKHLDTANIYSIHETKCIYPNCKEDFIPHNQLIEHWKQEHNSELLKLNFTSMNDFFIWKETEESKTLSYYSKQTSTKKNKTGSNLYYHCQRDGRAKPHRRKGDEQPKTARRNKKGVIKTGMFCPSRMMCKVDLTGAVSVTYIQYHNHLIEFKDTEHQPMPKSVLENVKLKLTLGDSVDNIHKDLHERNNSQDNHEVSDNNFQQKHAVSKRNLKEMASKLMMNQSMHPNDEDNNGSEVQDGNDMEHTDEDPLDLYPLVIDETYNEKESEMYLRKGAQAAVKEIAYLINDKNVRSLGMTHICTGLEKLAAEFKAMKNNEKQHNVNSRN